MSPCPVPSDVLHLGFPRVSGDEPPIFLVIAAIAAFSPRERG